ncbi:MAG: sigma 54-interacting transcriptional regulator [Planctomycetaceae bacterium]|nr:sigma 54-interacting transcriptional regulator [Planctomycetaceae bacterium]
MELDFRKDPQVLSRIVDEMADGVFTVDARGRFVAWSQGAERITGYSESEILGKPCQILEGPNCKGFAKIHDLLAMPPDDVPGICNQECKVQSKDGREIYIHGNLRLLTNEQDEVVGAVGTFKDMTSFLLTNERITLLEEQTRDRNAFDRMIGKSAIMQEVFRRLRLAAQSDVTVFISGESGTGKELAARAIHALSERKENPFIAINCSAIPETLLESELFGHVKGAFTGAVRDKEGMFQTANGGTLFLDEIGDLSPLIQLKLLRVIQEREIRRVGDETPETVNVRLLTATNRDLKSLVEEGSFREDFYYRIHVFEIHLPALCERREDIPLLIDFFLTELSEELGKEVTGIARDALQLMMSYDWPGNVRELRNALEHAFVTVSGETISLLDLPPEIREESRANPHSSSSQPRQWSDDERAEKEQIVDALRQTEGNRTQAAKLLDTSRVTLWKKMKKYDLSD